MLINAFTLIDAVNQFWKVCENGDRRSLTSTGLTYFYLCNVWNTCGRPISFRRQNTLICAELLISKPTLERHRNCLKQAGLIDFFSKGKGDPNITYQIMDVYYQEVKKVKNFTSPVTSGVTSGDDIKQSTEKEIFIIISEEVKNFYYLLELFLQDPGLSMHWRNQQFPPEKFSEGLQLWMVQNHGSKYIDFEKARKHFLFWIPSYHKELNKYQKSNENGFTKNHRSTGSAGGQLASTAVIEPGKGFNTVL